MKNSDKVCTDKEKWDIKYHYDKQEESLTLKECKALFDLQKKYDLDYKFRHIVVKK